MDLRAFPLCCPLKTLRSLHPRTQRQSRRFRRTRTEVVCRALSTAGPPTANLRDSQHHQCTGAHPATGQLVIAAVHCVAFRVALDVRRAIEMCRAASGCIEVGVGLTAYLGARARAPERVGNTSLLREPALSTTHVLARKRRCAHSVLCRVSGPVRGRRSCAAAIVDSAGGRCAVWPSGLPLWGLDSSSRMYLIIHAFFFALRADASGLII